MDVLSFREEFRLKNFLFQDDAKKFYRTQWSDCCWYLWIWKTFANTYWLTWFIVNLTNLPSDGLSEYWIFLTNWGVVTILLYFLLSITVTIYHLWCGRKPNTEPTELKTVSKSVDTSVAATPQQSEKLSWYHTLVWLVHISALNGSLIITITYFALLTPVFTASSINNHLINTVIMLIDLFIIAVPVRLFHFVYMSLYALTYTVFSLILFGTGYNTAIYAPLNWEMGPGLAAGLSVALIILGSLIAHSIMYGLYRLRIFFASKCITQSVDDSQPSGVQNIAYENE